MDPAVRADKFLSETRVLLLYFLSKTFSQFLFFHGTPLKPLQGPILEAHSRQVFINSPLLTKSGIFWILPAPHTTPPGCCGSLQDAVPTAVTPELSRTNRLHLAPICVSTSSSLKERSKNARGGNERLPCSSSPQPSAPSAAAPGDDRGNF